MSRSRQGHSPCGSVGWNAPQRMRYWYTLGHSPCGRVGWNCHWRLQQRSGCLVTPLAGVWVEIHMEFRSDCIAFRHSPCGSVGWNQKPQRGRRDLFPSLPLRECGLKFITMSNRYCFRKSLPLRECGLKSGVIISVRFAVIRHSPCGSVGWNKPY